MAAAVTTTAPSTEVKSETIDPLELEGTIVAILSAFSEGITNKQLEEKTPQIDVNQRMQAINRLLSIGRLEMRRVAGASNNEFLLKLKDQKNVEKIKGASQEETVVYNIIEGVGSNGIWIRDIRAQSGLSMAQLNKILKTLENRKLVKSIKALGVQRKKLYMLFELTPDEKLTGGAFYSEQEFDETFVDLLAQQCLKLLKSRAELASQRHGTNLAGARQASFVSTNEMSSHIKDSRISNVNLTEPDVERILDTLVYDGLAERDVNSSAVANSSAVKYRYCKPLDMPKGIATIPCTYCPLVNDCRPAGTVNPANCQYLTDWLADYTRDT